MNVLIHGNQIEITEALQKIIKKKISRLGKYFTTSPSTHAYITLSMTCDKPIVQITILLPRYLMRAEGKSHHLMTSIDLAVNNLERQIRKYKTYINRTRRRERSLHTAMIQRSVSINSPEDG